MTSGPLVVVGDALLDRDLVGRVERLSPDAPVPVVDEPQDRPRPGGAGLAALLAAADGREVVLVAALGDDPAGDALRALLAAGGVELVDLGSDGPTPEKVRVRADGRSLLRLDYGGRGGTPGAPGPQVEEVLRRAGAVLVSDYGRGVAAEPGMRALLADLPGRVPVVWDPHPRGPSPVPGARLVTPNASEARRAAPEQGDGDGWADVTARAAALVRRWEAAAVAVTLSARGALLVQGSPTGAPPLVVPAPSTPLSDPCGAGDRFASAAAGALLDGALPSEAVAVAVASASAFVASGGAAAVDVGVVDRAAAPEQRARTAGTSRPDAAVPDVQEVVHRVRASGGTVVATGGCFDLLHAGHISVLEAARRLGDCLVVLLNSDDSVRRLKGPDRPLVPQADRARVLAALACVDAVAVFDEDTPAEALRAVRPDVFAKGGDYALTDIPEASVVAEWGGQAVVLPYLDGRSTTALLQEAVRRAQ